MSTECEVHMIKGSKNVCGKLLHMGIDFSLTLNPDKVTCLECRRLEKSKKKVVKKKEN